MIFHREVTGKFNRKLLFSSEIAKAEVIIAIVEPVKPNGKRMSLLSFDSS